VRDSIFLRFVKYVARCVYGTGIYLHYRGHHLIFKDEYELGGGCARTGQCCERPVVRVGFIALTFPFYLQAFLFWQKHINGLIFVGTDGSPRDLAFRCTHYDRETKSCDSYESRPGMCRDYPRVLLLQTKPGFHQGCGYRAINRDSEALKKHIRSMGLTRETVEHLERELYVESSGVSLPE